MHRFSAFSNTKAGTNSFSMRRDDEEVAFAFEDVPAGAPSTALEFTEECKCAGDCLLWLLITGRLCASSSSRFAGSKLNSIMPLLSGIISGVIGDGVFGYKVCGLRASDADAGDRRFGCAAGSFSRIGALISPRYVGCFRPE
eukprot:g9275.t1